MFEVRIYIDDQKKKKQSSVTVWVERRYKQNFRRYCEKEISNKNSSSQRNQDCVWE